MKKIIYVLAMSLFFMPMLSIAQDKPGSEEVKKVIDYYLYGGGKGVVPMEAKFCGEVALEGENKNECVSVLSAQSIMKNQEAYLWMNFMVPAGEQAKILLQYSRDNMVRDVDTIAISSSIRYRTWKRVPTNKAGTWNVMILQEMPKSDVEVVQLQYSVVDENPE